MKEITLLTKKQAAEYAKVSRQTIYDWLEKDKLTHYYGASKNKNKVAWINPMELDKLTIIKCSKEFGRRLDH